MRTHLRLLFIPLCLQCEEKETFIQQIQSLDIETQAAIASCIQQVCFNQIKDTPKYERPSLTDRQYGEILSRGCASKRSFVPKYDLGKNFLTVWPAGRETETIIPSPGASSKCENELLVILLAAC